MVWWSVMCSCCGVCLTAALGPIQTQLNARGLLCRAASEVPIMQPGPAGDTTRTGCAYQREEAFRGWFPGAWEAKERLAIGDFHGNRLVGATKAKREGECKVKDRKCLAEVAGGGTDESCPKLLYKVLKKPMAVGCDTLLGARRRLAGGLAGGAETRKMSGGLGGPVVLQKVWQCEGLRL